MTVVNLFSKPCAITDCFLQPTCAKQPLVPPELKDTAIFIDEQAEDGTTILDTIARNQSPLRGTPVTLKCGGDAFILESNGKHTLRVGLQVQNIAHLATTFGPHPERGLTTEVLLLAGHRIAPLDDTLFFLEVVRPRNEIPAAAISDIPPVGNSGLHAPWRLEQDEWSIAKTIVRLMPLLPALTRGIDPELTPDRSARASLNVFVGTGARDPQTVTVDLQSTQCRDGFWTTEYWVENPFARIALVRKLKSLGFEQK